MRSKMGTSSRTHYHQGFCSSRPSLFKITTLLFIFSFLSLLLIKVDDFASQIATQTKTVAGHNLGPTPWHRFAPKQLDDNDNNNNKYSKASKLIKCSYLTCLLSSSTPPLQHHQHPHQDQNSSDSATCPSFFRWIHHDLEPWAQSKISQANLMEAQRNAAFRVVIVGGKLYVDFYYSCTQTRAMFTIWGLLQLLRRYPGMIPDVDLMFDCMDKSSVGRWRYRPGKRWPPPPLFRYCTTEAHFDIPFPDWSFWGWPETNIEPWDKEFKKIKKGSEAVTWRNKTPLAYWRGNPNVASPVRVELLSCNNTKLWGAEIFRQDWIKEKLGGFKTCELANQCKHRYKIYAEGFAWSVSLKYILSCGSMTLIISPQYEDFFTRGLMPRENYWPVSRANLCRSIKFAVDWGNANPSKAEGIGKGGQDLMRNLDMEKVYDYMYHLIVEYSKLQNFKPVTPSSAQQVCMESVLCYADQREREFLKDSISSPSSSIPCKLQSPNHDLIEDWIQKKRKTNNDVIQEMEMEMEMEKEKEKEKEKKVQAQQIEKRNTTTAPKKENMVQAQQIESRNATTAPENEKMVQEQQIENRNTTTALEKEKKLQAQQIDKRNTTTAPEKEKMVQAQQIENRNTTTAPEKEELQAQQIKWRNTTTAPEKEKMVQVQQIENRNTTTAPEKEKVQAQQIEWRNTTTGPEKEKMVQAQQLENRNTTTAPEKEKKVQAQQIEKTNTTIAPEKEKMVQAQQIENRNTTNTPEKEKKVQAQQIEKRNTTSEPSS